MNVRNKSRQVIGLTSPGLPEVVISPGKTEEVSSEMIKALKKCPVTSARFATGDLVDAEKDDKAQSKLDQEIEDAKIEAELEAEKAKAEAEERAAAEAGNTGGK